MPYTIDPNARAALFDIDGTLTSGGDFWRPLIDSPDVNRLKRRWLYATAMPHYMLSKTRLVSQAGFRDRWVRLMAWLMAGWSVSQAESVYGRLVELSLIPVRRLDVEAILKQHKNNGQPVILVSSMFEGIVQIYADVVGADTGLGSVVEFHDGICAGRIVGPTCSGAHKVEITRQYLERYHPTLSLPDCAAYSDSRSDVAFLAGAGYPVATYPDDAMRAAARERGWTVYEGE